MKKRISIVATSALASLSIAGAVEPDTCHSIKSDAERLICYDNATGRPFQSSVAMRGKWIVSEKTNPLDDSKTVTAILQAESGSNDRGERPVLVARCKSNKTEVYINFADYLGDDSSSVYSDWKHVTIRVGEEKAEKQRWSLSTDSQAAFAPRAISLLKKIADEERLVVQVTPYNANPITTVFSVSGAREAMKTVSSTCEWSF